MIHSFSLLLRFIEHQRELLCERIKIGDELGIFQKLILSKDVPHSPLGLLRMMGFIHIFSETGIHLYAVAAWVHAIAFAMSQLISVRLERARFVASFLSAFAWISLWCLSGFRPGMLRPIIIVILRSLALRLGFRWRTFSPLIVSLLMDGVAHFIFGPSPGRLLYALAVGGGLLALEKSRETGLIGTLKNHYALAMGSWLPVAVLEMITESTMAPWTPILSLLTIPFFASWVFPLVLALLIFHQDPWVHLVERLATSGIKHLAQAISTLGGIWCVSHWAVLVAVGFAAMSMFLRRKTITIVFCLGALFRCGMFFVPSSYVRGNHVTQLNVGQGDAALVQGVETGMVDVGSAWVYSPERMLKTLIRHSVDHLDWILLTHLDEDHAGALRDLRWLLPIGCVSYADASEIRMERMQKMLRQTGIEQRGDCVPFSTSVLRDPRTRANGNAVMRAVAIPIAGGLYLNAGDAGVAQELQWLKALRQEGLLAQNSRIILKVSHHGSRTSSGEKFLRELKPTEAWISSGRKNRYGHPSPFVIERLESLGIPYARTDQKGDLETARGR